jgi:hypothetical protein
MGKFNSKVEQLESRTVSWNELRSKFEVPLYSGIEVLIPMTRNSTVIVPCSLEKTDVSEEDIVPTFRIEGKPNQETCREQAVINLS